DHRHRRFRILRGDQFDHLMPGSVRQAHVGEAQRVAPFGEALPGFADGSGGLDQQAHATQGQGQQLADIALVVNYQGVLFAHALVRCAAVATRKVNLRRMGRQRLAAGPRRQSGHPGKRQMAYGVASKLLAKIRSDSGAVLAVAVLLPVFGSLAGALTTVVTVLERMPLVPAATVALTV